MTPNNSVERDPTSCACGVPSRLRRYGGPSRQTLGSRRQMSYLDLVGYLVLALFIACWVGGAISWCFAVYYMLKTMTRFHPKREWGRFLPFSLFTPWFFTDEGNLYRVRLLKASGLFLLFVALGIGLGVGGEALLSGATS